MPATVFETAGDVLDASSVKELLALNDIKYLTEMMNFPGAIAGDPEVLEKIAAAQALGKPVDGHAPGLSGEGLMTYVSRGISTDHECFTIEEAKEKLALGMKIIIREGSAAKNFDALIPLMDTHPKMIMFCSDDKHPDSLVDGHINQLCARAVNAGYNLFSILQAACINPVLHYKLDVGLLRVGDPADFILLENLSDFKVLATYIDGVKVAENGRSLIPNSILHPVIANEENPPSAPINRFGIGKINTEDLSQLQKNLVMSHACGTGEQVPQEIVRLMLLLKIQSLAYGHSGVQLKTVERLIEFYNLEIYPIIYTKGSLGASGDLAPLAHLCLPLISMGEVALKGEIISGENLLKKFNWEEIQLQSKEGLALLNGTQFMSAYGVWSCLQAKQLAENADSITAIAIDAFNCRLDPFHKLILQYT